MDYGYRWRAAALLCLLWANSSIAFAQALYRWQDDNGRVHYSDSPPADGHHHRRLEQTDLPALHLTPPADHRIYPSSPARNNANSGAHYQPRGKRDHHSPRQCRHYEKQLRRMERCVRDNTCGLTNRELRHQHHHWNLMYHKYCDF